MCVFEEAGAAGCEFWESEVAEDCDLSLFFQDFRWVYGVCIVEPEVFDVLREGDCGFWEQGVF